MPISFRFTVPPFDRLTPAEQDQVRAALDLAYYPKDTAILRAGDSAGFLHVVVKGLVQERHGTDVVGVLGPHDHFDSRSLFGTGKSNCYVALEDTICHLLPRDTLVELSRDNAAFGDAFYGEIADRLGALAAERAARQMSALMMARIRDTYIHPPLFVDGTTPLRDAARLMKSRKATSVLVRDPEGGHDGKERIGILTGMDLREAAIIRELPLTTPVAGLASYDLLVLDQDDLLVNALILMTKRSVRRVVIHDDDQIVGVLEQIDLLSFLSNHSEIIAVQIERATSPDDLRKASGDLLGLVRSLYVTGVRVPFIAELVTDLNRKVFRKLYELLAPAELLANSCLLVMGSEGRGEQILKTDQDNGLILRDGYDFPELPRITAEFTRLLIEFGYPACPGNIMVSNPEWTKSQTAWRDTLHHWIHHPDEASQLNLAIFYDAAPVAGDPLLLDAARRYLFDLLNDNKPFFSHFARPTLSFDTPVGRFAGLFSERGARHQLDLKKAGIFPLVHGVRSLAIERRLTETNTRERLFALEAAGVIDRTFAIELVEVFTFLQALRLKAGIDTTIAGTQTDNIVRLDSLTKMERDQLTDSLTLVKKFKEFITYHFHLNMF